MAENSHSAGPRARKDTRETFNNNNPDNAPLIQRGLITDTRVSPDLQVGLLARIDETGTATIGDLADLFASYPEPVGAVLALAEADVLDLEQVPVIDASTRVTRRQPPDRLEPAADTPPDTPAPPASGGVMANLPNSVETLLARSDAPVVTIVAGDDRRDALRVPHLHQTGPYLGMWRNGTSWDIYAGSSSDMANRIANGPHLIDPRPADHIVMITGGAVAFNLTEARSLERVFAEAIDGLHGTHLINLEIPQGAPVDAASYTRFRLIVAEVLVTLKTAGLAFGQCSNRELMAGPRFLPDERAPLRVDGRPDGELHRLEACGVVAEAVRTEDDSWVLLRGSQIRTAVVASANASISHRRAALLHSGVLIDAGDYLLLQRDLAFGSGSMASQFVTGAKSPGLAGWKPVEPELPEPQSAV